MVMLQRMIEEQITELSRSIADHPGEYDAYLRRGELLLQVERDQQALDDFELASQGMAEENQYRIIAGKARALFKLGRYDEALQVCDQGIQSNHFSENCYFVKAETQIAIGKYREARDTLVQLYRTSPKFAKTIRYQLLNEQAQRGYNPNYGGPKTY
jgi:adenylate cyclase